MKLRYPHLKKREFYMDRLLAFRDTDLVKIVTGIRRCGKSSLLNMASDILRSDGIDNEQIIEMNFESMEFYDFDSMKMYQYIKDRTIPGRRMYLFLDEVQRIPEWQNAVNSLRVDIDCDIYITGSNAFLLSSELSTYLSGRYVQIHMFPLSFSEFLTFHDYSLKSTLSPSGEQKLMIYKSGESYDPKELYTAYVRFGGMPAITDIGLDQEKVNILLDGIYSAVVVRDILERSQRKISGQRVITDAVLLRKIIMFLADNIGNNTSANSIGNTLVNEGLLKLSGRKSKPAPHTVQAYIEALKDAYIFYECKRFDIKGKEYLRTLGKYYIVDMGLRNYLLGYRDTDIGHILENVIYLELLRRGYGVAIGKIGAKEVDIIATKTNEKKYIQVTESMNDPATRNRELAPLKAIRDNYEKIVIAMNCDFPQTVEGIKIVRAMDFLLEPLVKSDNG